MRKLLCAVFAALLIAGCDPRGFAESFLEADEIVFADDLYDRLGLGDLDGIRAMVSAELEGDLAEATDRIEEIIPDQAPLEVEMVSANRMTGTGDAKPFLRIERLYRYEDGWVFYQVTIVRENEEPKALGFYVSPVSAAELERNEFGLAGKSPLHYAVLILAVAVPAFILYALVSCLRSPLSRRRKILWSIFIVLGLTQTSFNWATGEIGINLLAFQLLGAGFWIMSLGPVVLQLGIPLGAVLFHYRLRRAKKRVAVAEASGVAITLDAAFSGGGEGGSGGGGGGDGGGGGGD